MDTQTWTHRHGHTDMDTQTWTQTWTHRHEYTDMDTQTWTHRHGHTGTNTRARTRALTYTHWDTSTHTHRNANTDTDTYIHIHICVPVPELWLWWNQVVASFWHEVWAVVAGARLGRGKMRESAQWWGPGRRNRRAFVMRRWRYLCGSSCVRMGRFGGTHTCVCK